MRKNTLLALAFTALSFTACQQEDFLSENNKVEKELDTTTNGIQVVDGYLSFASKDLFQNYISSLKDKQDNSGISTRVTQQNINGFTSINSLKAQVAVANTRSEDSEEGTEDEYRISITEAQIWGAIKYNGKWRGIRFTHSD